MVDMVFTNTCTPLCILIASDVIEGQGLADLAELKKRTLTNLYNQRPAWLDDAHAALDSAVAAAYGWADYSPTMTDNEILARLLALNLARAAEHKSLVK